MSSSSSFGIDDLTGFSATANSGEKSDKSKIERQITNLLAITEKKIHLLFKDQYDEPFARIYVKDHPEIISTNITKFAKFLCACYHEEYGTPVGSEALNNFIRTLQGQAEFGDLQYSLSLRVAEHDGDFYYDLTNKKHQCIKISKKDASWQLLDKTPVPLFKRYNQIPQDLPSTTLLADNKEHEDPLEAFFSKLTNIKDQETKLLAKVALISYFVPNIPHIILIIHGGKGSAKSTFQRLLKDIVDPAKPALLTLHSKPEEFVLQLSQNYLIAFDNIKYLPRWLPDEACRAATGIGQTTRKLFTNDEVKVFEYKHCLMFNGINLVFSEPDVIDRSIVIELTEIDEDDRKTEEEILNEFKSLKPLLLASIFNTLAKAIAIQSTIKMKKLPRMADFAVWGEAIARSLGYKENEFINAYYNNIGFQNSEIVESNPLGLAIKKFVEINSVNDKMTLFEGTPKELLDRLNAIAVQEDIDTNQRDWPNNRNWLIKRLKTIKSNLHKVLGIKISIGRDSKTNTSIIKIEKNNSGNSGEHNISPENQSLSPYLDGLSPVSDKLSPEENQKLITKSKDYGDTGHTGDKSSYIMEAEDKTNDDTRKNLDSKTDSLIGYREPFYYCKEHPKVENIYRETIEHHILYSAVHKSP